MPRTDHAMPGVYNSTSLSLPDGVGVALAVNSAGVLQAEGANVSTVQDNSFTTLNAKATAGSVYGFIVINTTGSVRYLQLHNTATTPAGNATALKKFLIPANSMLVLGETDWGGPLAFSTGIAYANSSVAATYTAGSAGDLLLDLQYR